MSCDRNVIRDSRRLEGGRTLTYIGCGIFSYSLAFVLVLIVLLDVKDQQSERDAAL